MLIKSNHNARFMVDYGPTMRIDKFLKVSRLIKRREVAKELCDDSDVLLNGKIAKPSAEVNVGDTMELHLGRHTLIVKILAVKPYANKTDAGEMYEVLQDIVSPKSDVRDE